MPKPQRQSVEPISGRTWRRGEAFGEEDKPGNLDIRGVHKHTAIIALVCS